MATICFFCKKSRRGLEDMKECRMQASKKSAKAVLIHLANLINTKLIFEADASLCKACVNKLVCYDRLTVRLLKVQQQLAKELQDTLIIAEKQTKEEELTDSEAVNHATVEVELESGGAVKEELIEIENMVEEGGLEKDAAMEIAVLETDMSVESVESPGGQEGFFSDDSEGSSESTQKNSTTKQTTTKPGRQSVPLCSVCGQEFSTKKKLHEHVSSMHKRKSFKCSICNVTRKNSDYLELHMNVHEGLTELECRYCDKIFSRVSHTLEHMRVHWQRLDYQCEKCGQLFAQGGLLYNHRKIHEAEENPLICQHCNLKCRTRKTYRNHLMTHSSDRPRFPCPRCSKTFAERYTLKVHMQTHGETLPYLKWKRKEKQSSEGLAKEPADNVNITAENSQRTDEEKEIMDYACTICELRFFSRTQLNKHLETAHDVIIT